MRGASYLFGEGPGLGKIMTNTGKNKLNKKRNMITRIHNDWRIKIKPGLGWNGMVGGMAWGLK